MPDLEGKTRTQAENALTALGLSVDVTEEFSDSVDKGYVISTSPKAGSKVDKGGMVQVVVSKGSEADAMVAVPDLRNRDEATAKQLLGSSELISGTASTASSDSVDEGKIISQSPEAGTQIEKGTKVDYVVSTGPEMVYVGDYKGFSRDQIEDKLNGLEIRWESEYDNSGEYPEGTVISHEHRDENVPKGTTITVVLSKGKEKVTVPNVSSYKMNDAKAKMPSNITIKEDYSKTTTDPNLDNVVYQQSVTGEVEINSTVTLYAYKYVEPEPSTPPSGSDTTGTESENTGNQGSGTGTQNGGSENQNEDATVTTGTNAGSGTTEQTLTAP